MKPAIPSASRLAKATRICAWPATSPSGVNIVPGSIKIPASETNRRAITSEGRSNGC